MPTTGSAGVTSGGCIAGIGSKRVDAFIAPILWRLEIWEVDVPDSAESITRYMRRAFARASFRGSLSEREREMRSP